MKLSWSLGFDLFRVRRVARARVRVRVRVSLTQTPTLTLTLVTRQIDYQAANSKPLHTLYPECFISTSNVLKYLLEAKNSSEYSQQFCQTLKFECLDYLPCLCKIPIQN